MLGQQVGVGARGGLVGGDDHAAGVGHVPSRSCRSRVSAAGDHRGHPLAGRVQRGAPRPGGLLGVQRLAEAGRVLLAGAVAPARLAGVGQEHHRPDHTVGQRLGVAVGVVGLRAQQPVGVGLRR